MKITNYIPSQYIARVINHYFYMNFRKKILAIFFVSIILAVNYLLTDSLLICCCLLATMALSLLIFILVNKQLKQTNWYINHFIDSQKFLRNIPHNLEICNLGSNPGKFAFDYDDMSSKGENWAIGPQSLSYDFRVLKNYFSYLKDGGIVLITIAPLSSCLRDYPDDRSNAKYYPFLDTSLIVNYSSGINFSYIRYPVLSAPKAIRYLIRDVPPDNRFLINTNPMSSEEIEQDAVNWLKGWKNQFSIINLNSGIVSEENQSAIVYNTKLLSEMIDFCLVRNLKPVLVLPPVTKELRSKFPEIFLELYVYSFIRNSNTQHIKVLDYFNDERFIDNGLYFNSFFLNSKGRRLFTNSVLLDIKQI